MAFRFHQSQDRTFVDSLVIWKPPKVFVMARCSDWWHCLALRFLVNLPQNGVSISPVPRSGLSRIPSDLQNDWKSLYWSDVLIDVTALLLRLLIKMPQNGVSIFHFLFLELPELFILQFSSLPSYHSFPLLFILQTFYSWNFSFPPLTILRIYIHV